MAFKNATNIPLSLAVWLCHDSYDYNPDPYTISATTLLKPLRSLILSKRIPTEKDTEIDDLIASRLGTATHTAIEGAWIDSPQFALLKLGIPEAVVEKLRINPKEPGGEFDVYLEQRSTKKVGKWTVSGKYDQIVNGILEDNKTTKTYSYIKQSSTKKYGQQGSIYRWLNPEIIDSDYLHINYLFTDWNPIDIRREGYPKSKILVQKIEMMSVAETQKFIELRLTEIEHYLNSDQKDLPLCTDEELWAKAPVWKYYKNPTKVIKSTKNYTTAIEANARLAVDGYVGMVIEIKGEVKFCRYCSANKICLQAEQLVHEGRLVL